MTKKKWGETEINLTLTAEEILSLATYVHTAYKAEKEKGTYPPYVNEILACYKKLSAIYDETPEGKTMKKNSDEIMNQQNREKGRHK